jgi:heterodisulfide reductase subunit A
LLTVSRNQDGFFLEAHPKLRPVDAATGGVFFAGCAESPKDIRDSVTQASAAAARAGILMAKGHVTVEAITPIVYPDKCKACGLCVKICPYNAISLDKDLKKVEIIEAACGGCGTCAAECNFGALTQKHFTDEQITAQIDAITENEPEKKIVAFCCNWCSYAGADFAGVSRMQYPPNARIIRTMCSGRVAPKFIERAFARGAASVLVSGCHLGDCHYINANIQTQKRVERMWKKMEQNGLDKQRLQLLWASAAEGEKFASKMHEMKMIVENVKPEEIEKAKKVFAKALEGG